MNAIYAEYSSYASYNTCANNKSFEMSEYLEILPIITTARYLYLTCNILECYAEISNNYYCPILIFDHATF